MQRGSMTGDEYFEGAEKKLEIAVNPGLNLRGLGGAFWREVVAAARATILSTLHDATGYDACLLAESSLFVADDRVTMITCGRTRLIDAAEAILARIDRDAIRYLVYQRRNEDFPARQQTSFAADAARLAQWVQGRVHRFGEREDHHIQLFASDRVQPAMPRDATLEVLMHAVPEPVTRGLTDPHAAKRGERVAWLADLLGPASADRRFHDHVFSPPGYSMNAVSGRTYHTLHLTRQAHGSYVSYETNDPRCLDPADLVRWLVQHFRPRAFDVLSFLPDGAPTFTAHDDLTPGFGLGDHTRTHLPCGLQVTFQHYRRRVDRACEVRP